MNETKPTNENPPQKKRSRRNYDAEFKKAAVEHCARHGGDVHRMAGELGVNHRTLRDWVEAARATSAPAAPPRTVAELETEVRRLKGELARVTEQRETGRRASGRGALPVAGRFAQRLLRLAAARCEPPPERGCPTHRGVAARL